MGLVFLDIETSGLDPNYHQPLEIAWVTLDGRETEFSLHYDADRCDPEAMEVNRIGKRRQAQLVADSQAVAIMLGQLHEQTIVANNVTFDLSFLSAFLRRMNARIPWERTGFELKSLVAGRLGVSPEMVSTSQIVRHFKMEAVDKHTALGDARWNREIYLALQLYEG